MARPVVTFTNTSSATITSLNFGNVDASGQSSVVPIMVWNNKSGGSTLSNMTSVTITTKTFNGLNTGDTIPNGQGVVTGLYMTEECISQGDSSYTAIGGTTTAPIGSAAGGTGTINGTIGGDAAVVNLILTAPSNVVAGAVNFLLRVTYLYQ